MCLVPACATQVLFVSLDDVYIKSWLFLIIAAEKEAVHAAERAERKLQLRDKVSIVG